MRAFHPLVLTAGILTFCACRTDEPVDPDGPSASVRIEVICTDEGPGIANVELAMQDGFTTGNGLGLGLPGTRRLVDVFELQTEPGQGTRIRLVKWARA